MEWTICLNRALEYIEDNLCGDIDIDKVAQNAYISPFYLQRGFQMLTGYSLGEYIRNRRLYESALALLSTREKIIDIALRYGYETPESFTKAFVRFHGSSPSDVRKKSKNFRSFPALKIHIEITGGDKMDYSIKPMNGFTVIGFEREFSFENSYKEIPEFWDEIYAKYANVYAGNPPENAVERAILNNGIGEYGVCFDGGKGNKFRYMIAGKYLGGEIPEGMTTFEIPACEWAKFKCLGPMPDSIQTLNTQIFKEWLPNSSEYEIAHPLNIEWYSADGDNSSADYQSGIWIPVKRK